MVKVILVTGATGNQGGAVVAALLEQNADVEILAVTRNATSASAKKLAEKSPKVKIVEGNLDDAAALFKEAAKIASSPIWGVFSVQTFMGNGGVENEEKQGKALVDEAISHDVKHFVQTSVDRGGDRSFDNPTNVPHFKSKHNIEHHLVEKAKGSNMSWTILRPVAFFDNFVPGFMGKAFVTMWRVALQGKPLQLIASKDIGHFAALAFLNPDQFKNKALSLAGDELTVDQFAKVYEEKTGQPLAFTYDFVASAFLYMVKEMGLMFKWFHDEGYAANIPELRKLHPGLKDAGAWLEKDSPFTTK